MKISFLKFKFHTSSPWFYDILESPLSWLTLLLLYRVPLSWSQPWVSYSLSSYLFLLPLLKSFLHVFSFSVVEVFVKNRPHDLFVLRNFLLYSPLRHLFPWIIWVNFIFPIKTNSFTSPIVSRFILNHV